MNETSLNLLEEQARAKLRSTREAVLCVSCVGLLNASFFVWLVWMLCVRNRPGIAIAALMLVLGSFTHLLLLAFLAKRRRRIAGPMAVSGICIVLALIGGNAFAGRLCSKERSYWINHIPDSLLGWYPRPNLKPGRFDYLNQTYYLAATDCYGHRNSLSYPGDRFLPVVIQGDSNLFGFGLRDDETLAALMNRAPEFPPTYNMGVSGFDVNQYYFQFEQLKREFRIGRRVIFFNSANDFTSSVLSSTNLIRRPYLTVRDNEVIEVRNNTSPVPVAGYGMHFLPKYARYDPLIRYDAGAWAEAWPVWLLRFPLCQIVGDTFQEGFLKKVGRYPTVQLEDPDWLLADKERWLEPWRSYTHDFVRIVARLAGQHAPCILVYLPTRKQVVPEDLEAARQRIAGKGMSEFQPSALAEFMREACLRTGIMFLDLTPSLSSQEKPSRLFIPGDTHLSAGGVAVCAGEIVRFLSKSALPDACTSDCAARCSSPCNQGRTPGKARDGRGLNRPRPVIY